MRPAARIAPHRSLTGKARRRESPSRSNPGNTFLFRSRPLPRLTDRAIAPRAWKASGTSYRMTSAAFPPGSSSEHWSEVARNHVFSRNVAARRHPPRSGELKATRLQKRPGPPVCGGDAGWRGRADGIPGGVELSLTWQGRVIAAGDSQGDKDWNVPHSTHPSCRRIQWQSSPTTSRAVYVAKFSKLDTYPAAQVYNLTYLAGSQLQEEEEEDKSRADRSHHQDSSGQFTTCEIPVSPPHP